MQSTYGLTSDQTWELVHGWDGLEGSYVNRLRSLGHELAEEYNPIDSSLFYLIFHVPTKAPRSRIKTHAQLRVVGFEVDVHRISHGGKNYPGMTRYVITALTEKDEPVSFSVDEATARKMGVWPS